MLDGKEGLQWTRIPLFRYLETTFPVSHALQKYPSRMVADIKRRTMPHLSESAERLP